jgi:hypothetical protein
VLIVSRNCEQTSEEIVNSVPLPKKDEEETIRYGDASEGTANAAGDESTPTPAAAKGKEKAASVVQNPEDGTAGDSEDRLDESVEDEPPLDPEGQRCAEIFKFEVPCMVEAIQELREAFIITFQRVKLEEKQRVSSCEKERKELLAIEIDESPRMYRWMSSMSLPSNWKKT